MYTVRNISNSSDYAGSWKSFLNWTIDYDRQLVHFQLSLSPVLFKLDNEFGFGFADQKGSVKNSDVLVFTKGPNEISVKVSRICTYNQCCHRCSRYNSNLTNLFSCDKSRKDNTCMLLVTESSKHNPS